MQKLVLICTSIIFLSACNSKHSTGETNLQNGQKWKVNAEMKPHIDQGIGVLKAYLSQGNTDYSALEKALQVQNTDLIESRTLKGESHDELHKWLHPHMALIEKLSKAKDLTEANTIISQIEQSFKNHQNYFE